MYYPEFKKASKKHLISCECLIKNIENCKSNQIHILSTIYYLSGYIFETILKFSIYSAIGYDKNEDITKLDSNNLIYKNDIGIHSLKKLKRTVESKNITSFSGYENKKLFNSWNSEIRYKSSINFSKDEIISFFKFAEKTYISLQLYK